MSNQTNFNDQLGRLLALLKRLNDDVAEVKNILNDARTGAVDTSAFDAALDKLDNIDTSLEGVFQPSATPTPEPTTAPAPETAPATEPTTEPTPVLAEPEPTPEVAAPVDTNDTTGNG